MSQPATLTVNYTPVTGPGMVVVVLRQRCRSASNGKLLDTLLARYSNQSSIPDQSGRRDRADGSLYISNQVSFPPSGTSGTTPAACRSSGEPLDQYAHHVHSTSVLAPIAASIGDTQFVPAGVTFGPDGNLYVALQRAAMTETRMWSYRATPGNIVRLRHHRQQRRTDVCQQLPSHRDHQHRGRKRTARTGRHRLRRHPLGPEQPVRRQLRRRQQRATSSRSRTPLPIHPQHLHQGGREPHLPDGGAVEER